MSQIQLWLLLEQVILSGQMPASDLMALLNEDPAFAAWYTPRAEQRMHAV